jgi:hypothetical protein
MRFNNLVDTAVTGTFLGLVISLVLLSVAEWGRLLRGARPPTLSETEPVWLPAATGANGNPAAALGAAALAFTLLREVSGQAEIDRAQARAEQCDCAVAQTPRGRQHTFLTALDDRYRGVRRCC